MDAFFAAKSLDEQNIAFKQLPLDKLDKLLRYVYVTGCGKMSSRVILTFTCVYICSCSWYFGKEQQMKTGRSEAQFKYVEASDGSVGAFFTRKFIQTCQTVPIWDNYYMSVFMRGQRGHNPDSEPALTQPCLTRNGFIKLKVNMIPWFCSISVHRMYS